MYLYPKSLICGVVRQRQLSWMLKRKQCSISKDPESCPTRTNAIRVNFHKDHVEILGSESKPSRFHYLWLRDHCRCALCYNVLTHQRKTDILTISSSIKPLKYDVVNGKLQVQWPGGHVSSYCLAWLQQQTLLEYNKQASLVNRSMWQKAPKNIAHISSTSFLHSNKGVAELMKSLVTFGVGFVEGVETSVEATEKIIRRIGPPQRTLFGDVWEMKPSEYHEDTAYSSEALGAHTDNTYFTEAAGLQVFHILKHEGEGGDTLLVDGFRAALDVKVRDEESYEILSSTSIPSEYLEPGETHTVVAPVLSMHPVSGQLQQIRFNLYDRACMTTVPFDRVMAWYRALRLLSEAVRDPAGEFWLRLRPGQVLFVDNWRVLHGRSAYTGQRWVTGAYISRTDYLSRARVCGVLSTDI